jgi:hypothetical protein
MSEPLQEVLSYHDDWMVNVLLNNGSVYAFNTEMWPEHGDESRWLPVMRRARWEAVDLAKRGADPFCRVEIFDGFNQHDLVDAVNEAAESLPDDAFRQLINR